VLLAVDLIDLVILQWRIDVVRVVVDCLDGQFNGERQASLVEATAGGGPAPQLETGVDDEALVVDGTDWEIKQTWIVHCLQKSELIIS
jgi:hypothetical protein